VTDIVDEYCRLVDEGAPVDDPRLLRLSERMTAEDRANAASRLGAEAQSAYREADLLQAWQRSRKIVPLR
jgi:hypothetical protein